MSEHDSIPTLDPTFLRKTERDLRLKVCGMKILENTKEVAALVPDYLGFIFYKKSSRFFNGTIPTLPTSIKKVGVFVDASIDDIIKNMKIYSLDMVQLHGEESPEFCKKLKHKFSKKPALHKAELIKVFSIKDQFNFEVLLPYELVCDYFLFDTKGKLPGGNGFTFNWEVLKDYPSTKPYFLSGGIGLEEVDQLLEFLQQRASRYCHAIDVNSKFEIGPGLKDTHKIAKFKKAIQPNI